MLQLLNIAAAIRYQSLPFVINAAFSRLAATAACSRRDRMASLVRYTTAGPPAICGHCVAATDHTRSIAALQQIRAPPNAISSCRLQARRIALKYFKEPIGVKTHPPQRPSCFALPL